MDKVDKIAFIDFIAPYCQTIKQRGFFPSVCIAQACLESAWGTSELCAVNNFFGRKCAYGEPYVKMTKERLDDGTWVEEERWFQRYDTIHEAVNDYCSRLLKPWYTLDFSSAEGFLQSIAGKYATDDKYFNKVWSIVEEYDLLKYD